MIKYLNKHWKSILKMEIHSDSFTKLQQYISKEREIKTIFPNDKNIFNALNLTTFEDIQVIILGQDPYHQIDQAHGLSFSVPTGITPPPSLKNIYREIETDTKIVKNFSKGNLKQWSMQGVLLLNTVLTVEENKPASHKGKGWELFTDAIIQKISQEKEHCVFILWGNDAQKKEILINAAKHLVLKSTHPSPLSAYRGFFGNKHFSKTNSYLIKHKKAPIIW